MSADNQQLLSFVNWLAFYTRDDRVLNERMLEFRNVCDNAICVSAENLEISLG